MQEEVTRGAVTLIVDGAKLSEQVFEKAVKKFLEESKKIWEENAQFWDNAMGDESNEFHREVEFTSFPRGVEDGS